MSPKYSHIPPILDSKATPTEQMPLSASAATSPAHLVPCLSIRQQRTVYPHPVAEVTENTLMQGAI